MAKNRIHTLRRSQQGVTLIEVLVTVLVLSIGFLGLAALQLMALRSSQQALQQSMGTMYSYSILDSMRANANGDSARAGLYNADDLCAPPTGTSLQAKDQNFWVKSFQSQLGDTACGDIQCSSQGICDVTLRWTAANDRQSQATVTTRTEL